MKVIDFKRDLTGITPVVSEQAMLCISKVDREQLRKAMGKNQSDGRVKSIHKFDSEYSLKEGEYFQEPIFENTYYADIYNVEPFGRYILARTDWNDYLDNREVMPLATAIGKLLKPDISDSEIERLKHITGNYMNAGSVHDKVINRIGVITEHLGIWFLDEKTVDTFWKNKDRFVSENYKLASSIIVDKEFGEEEYLNLRKETAKFEWIIRDESNLTYWLKNRFVHIPPDNKWVLKFIWDHTVKNRITYLRSMSGRNPVIKDYLQTATEIYARSEAHNGYASTYNKEKISKVLEPYGEDYSFLDNILTFEDIGKIKEIAEKYPSLFNTDYVKIKL